jgi:hypothetical protein
MDTPSQSRTTWGQGNIKRDRLRNILPGDNHLSLRPTWNRGVSELNHYRLMFHNIREETCCWEIYPSTHSTYPPSSSGPQLLWVRD